MSYETPPRTALLGGCAQYFRSTMLRLAIKETNELAYYISWWLAVLHSTKNQP